MSESVMIGLRKPKNVASKDFGEAGDRALLSGGIRARLLGLSGAIAIALQQRNGFKKNCCGHQKI
jgi:hypothetical protein